jgi:ZIP family zinc transporter
MDQWAQGWVLTTLSSVLCIFGCLIIYLDDIYYFVFPKFLTSRYKFQINENYTFLTGSLAFSSGCLLFTSLFRLLPEALNYLRDSTDDVDVVSEEWLNFYLITSFIIGIAICLSFNTLLHLLTSESVVHCNHGENGVEEEMSELNENHNHENHNHENHNHNHDNHNHTQEIQTHDNHAHASEVHSHDHSHQENQSPNHSHTHSEQEGEVRPFPDENSPLIPPVIKHKKSFIHYILPHGDEIDNVGECKGYSSAEMCLYKSREDVSKLHFCEIPELTGHPETDPCNDNISVHSRVYSTHSLKLHHHGTHEDHTTHKQDHHHHVNSPLSRLLLIGIQTTLAITLHKFPEGFITFITSETNPQLGVSIFISLLFHNFTEGFSMCLPLYYSFASGSSKRFAKLKAVGISAVLGGLSQPFGAFLGYLFLKYNNSTGNGGPIDLNHLNFVFGITMAITSGFLSVIGLSMYGSAVSFGGSLNFVLLWCVAGIAIIGSSFVISTH